MTVFSELLQMTQTQDEPQRLLLLFANAEAKNPKKSKSHQQGTITPVMCVDKAPEDLTDFSSLVKEADGINNGWNFLFIASLSGENGKAPTTEEADPYLNKMTNDVEMGNIGQYLVVDRDENRIELQSH